MRAFVPIKNTFTKQDPNLVFSFYIFLQPTQTCFLAGFWLEKGKRERKQDGSQGTSLAAAAAAPAWKVALAMLAAAPAAPLMVVCSWTPYLPSHLSSVRIWVALVTVVSLISDSEEAT